MAFPAFRESTMEMGISLRGRARAGGGRRFRLSEARVFTQGWTGCRCFWRTSGHARASGSRATVGRASGFGVPRPVPRRYRAEPEPASAGAAQNLNFESSEHQRRPSSSEFLILEGDSRERPLFRGRGGRGFGPITSASLVPLGAGRAPPGTIAARSLALAASTPWYLTRFCRGRGTQAARRATS